MSGCTVSIRLVLVSERVSNCQRLVAGELCVIRPSALFGNHVEITGSLPDFPINRSRKHWRLASY